MQVGEGPEGVGPRTMQESRKGGKEGWKGERKERKKVETKR